MSSIKSCFRLFAKEIKSIIEKYGNKKIEDVTLAQAYQGMRGITGLVTETSLLDANEVHIDLINTKLNFISIAFRTIIFRIECYIYFPNNF